MFNGALADLSLGSNPWTLGRYTYAGGNPTTLIEDDGHAPLCEPEGIGRCPVEGINPSSSGETQAADFKVSRLGEAPAPDLYLICDHDGSGCDHSPDELRIIQDLLAENLQQVLLTPMDASACAEHDCSTLGPAQIAWCYTHFDMCGGALEAAHVARTVATALDADPQLNVDIGRSNAIRHALWMALMVAKHDIPERDALSLGVAHEVDGTIGNASWGSDDSKIDLHNNFVGVALGVGLARNSEYVEVQADAIHYLYIMATSTAECPHCLNIHGASF
jgi:hypothetical protein